jgi:four helix bundle protein
MDNARGHLKLEVSKQRIVLVSELYIVTNDFPKHEQYGIISQIRRAGVSIPANISEGAARKGIKEFLHFLSISMGSISELETLLIISKKVNYLNEFQYNKLISQLSSIARLLTGLQKSLNNKIQLKGSQ